MVTRDCVIHIQNLYDVTKLILSKVVAISVLCVITESLVLCLVTLNE
jgi:hypothetical protein